MNFEIFKKYEDRILSKTTDRFGGVSKAPYQSLNLALHVKDNPIDVLKNREILSQKYNLPLQNIIYMDQVHKDSVVLIKDPLVNKIENCDAIVTNIKNIPLMVMVADCVPLSFYDPNKNVIAVAHAGRNGTFLNIAQKTVDKMVEEFGSDTNDIRVGVGVSIGVCCYEVGKDLADICQKSFGQEYVAKRDDSYFIDLKKLNRDQLIDCGIKAENIEVSDECSCCNESYFSYRREGVTGRFASIMMIK